MIALVRCRKHYPRRPRHHRLPLPSFFRRNGIIGAQVHGHHRGAARSRARGRVRAAQHAVAYARRWTVEQKKGLLLLEFVNYRYGGHS
jgi:hypothetical protein